MICPSHSPPPLPTLPCSGTWRPCSPLLATFSFLFPTTNPLFNLYRFHKLCTFLNKFMFFKTSQKKYSFLARHHHLPVEAETHHLLKHKWEGRRKTKGEIKDKQTQQNNGKLYLCVQINIYTQNPIHIGVCVYTFPSYQGIMLINTPMFNRHQSISICVIG